MPSNHLPGTNNKLYRNSILNPQCAHLRFYHEVSKALLPLFTQKALFGVMDFTIQYCIHDTLQID